MSVQRNEAGEVIWFGSCTMCCVLTPVQRWDEGGCDVCGGGKRAESAAATTEVPVEAAEPVDLIEVPEQRPEQYEYDSTSEPFG